MRSNERSSLKNFFRGLVGGLLKRLCRLRVPLNLSCLWSTGTFSSVLLAILILSGLFLSFYYQPSTDQAFASIVTIMHDVKGGWLFRSLHANGASMFFMVTYVHLFRAIYNGSYKKPREKLWVIGVILMLLMMGTAFTGYILPWGQMSYWGGTVMTNMLASMPLVGPALVEDILGGFSVDNPALLSRFFVLHILMAFVLLGFVGYHVSVLRAVGSNNPSGTEPKSAKETIPFHPYYMARDLFVLMVFLAVYTAVVFFAPNIFGHSGNSLPADPLVTPEHIMPEWYFLPFFTILRAVTVDILAPFSSTVWISSTLGGAILMFGSLLALFALPRLDSSPVRSLKFRPLSRVFFWLLVLDCLALGFIGTQPIEEPFMTLGQIATFYYFLHFLFILPLLSRFEKTKPLPASLA